MITNSLLIDFLNKSGVVCDSIEHLDGYQIPREILLDKTKYIAIKNFIPELKHCFSSSYMTSLQAPAEDNQRWPLLNIVRQVLRSSCYRLQPRRISAGYGPSGKKKYRRIFEIQKLKVSNTDGVALGVAMEE